MYPGHVPMEEYQVRVGAQVMSGDGHKLGKVCAVDRTTLTVEKGLLFKQDFRIPRSAINSYDQTGDGTVFLNVTEDQARTSGWEHATD